MISNGFHERELRTLRGLRTPERIQRFLDDEVGYNKEKSGPTCRSPRRVMRDRVAQCLEGAKLFGARRRCVQGWAPFLLDLEAVRDDDHVLALFRQRGCWGAIAKSNYAGLRFREPVYRSAARAGDVVLRALLQPGRRKDAADLFASSEPGALRPHPNG